jgi:hypothetical protein
MLYSSDVVDSVIGKPQIETQPALNFMYRLETVLDNFVYGDKSPVIVQIKTESVGWRRVILRLQLQVTITSLS